MRFKFKTFAAFSAILLVSAICRAEMRVVVDRNPDAKATADFQFTQVATPVADNAAASASYTIISGRPDPNGGGPDVLKDGRLPDGSDAPGDSFFFSQGSNGGRLLLDLGRLIEVKEIDTYSWHTDTRAPQVYALYASDGTSVGFDAKPKRPADPEKAGWKKLADVDTRPAAGPVGGQYGVSVGDTAGTVGKFRYLLFDIFRTEDADPFGNTFFSEICVIDRNAPAATAGPKTRPSGAQIIIDTTQTPELKDWAEQQLRPVLEKWYPILVEALPGDGFTAPKRFTVTFVKDKPGVADTSGTRVRCAANWFEHNLRGEAKGAVVHEMVHVVQQYHGGNPGWLVEGIADYYRWFKYEPPAVRPHPDLSRAKYTDSYRTTAAFLNYVSDEHDKGLVPKLNAAMRQGKYDAALWKQFTGKTVEELWDEYVTAERK